MQFLFHSLLRAIVSIISGTKKQDRLIIFGVRRSGNHALTNWLANAIENEPTTLSPIGKSSPLSHCHVNTSGSIVHLNELNELSLRATLFLFIKCRRFTKRANRLILSFEDVRPSEYLNFRRLQGNEIMITRSSLEIISSRFHNINQKAQQGIGWSRQSCDSYFMQTLEEYLAYRTSSELNWHYNDWLDKSEWRIEFLKKIGLDSDLMPQHSAIGGGSSFHGTSGKIESNMEQRMQKVNPQGPWLTFLMKTIHEYPELFTLEETEVAQKFSRDSSLP